MIEITDVVAILSFVVAIISVFISKRKINSDIAENITNAAVAMLTPYQSRVSTLEAKIELLHVLRQQDESKVKNLERLLMIAVRHIGIEETLPKELRSWLDEQID